MSSCLRVTLRPHSNNANLWSLVTTINKLTISRSTRNLLLSNILINIKRLFKQLKTITSRVLCNNRAQHRKKSRRHKLCKSGDYSVTTWQWFNILLREFHVNSDIIAIVLPTMIWWCVNIQVRLFPAALIFIVIWHKSWVILNPYQSHVHP